MKPSADYYRCQLINILTTLYPDCEAAHAAILREISALDDEHHRWHVTQHEVRHLASYALIPPGPGLLLDVSDLISPVLSSLKKWTVKPAAFKGFNLERDPLPYGDATVDGVMLLETIEHYNVDPLYSLIEVNRVLKPGGFLLISTPNAVSWYSILRALNGQHPSRFAVYNQDATENCIHAREYAPHELPAIMSAAGFGEFHLRTFDYGNEPPFTPVPGYSDDLRGETVFCLGRKVGRPTHRRLTPFYLADEPYEG